jgi:hypothetical protein
MQRSIVELPPARRLRVYAFDPSLAQRIDTAGVQEIIVRVPWETLEPGPVGEYIEVVDVDPASGVFYPPVDLDDPNLLAQDGLTPSEGNPQFHQQMAYAVAMTTIGHFERALGRVALWAPQRRDPKSSGTKKWKTEFVRRLRIYPHALRDRNAYYSPGKKALLFGYFPVTARDADNTPGTTVFACLSHDIVAHECTHALLDGIHPRFTEPSNPDVQAFHEAFADIVALFQHFSYPGVLLNQIARTRGNLATESLLGQLAQQFGQATGRGAALRDALGGKNEKGEWKRTKPDPMKLDATMEPHDRGAILVAAVFGAFLLVYRSRTADLFRIATQGTGVLPLGDIHPDLARRLADEASRCARDLLQMCIRALDYCPPVNITFGEYLRAVITADINLNPDDDYGYRVALVESFREWGIYPRGIRSMSIEALVWPSGAEAIAEAEMVPADDRSMRVAPSKNDVNRALAVSAKAVHKLFTAKQTMTRKGASDAPAYEGPTQFHKWDLSSDRYQVWKNMEESRAALWRWAVLGDGRKYAKAFGLVLDRNAPRTIYRNDAGVPTVEVHSVRTALRRDARGATVTDLVIEVTQRRRGYFNEDDQKKADAGTTPLARHEDGDFKFRSGCTIVIDTTKNVFRHIIRTPSIDDEAALAQARRYLTGETDSAGSAFDGQRRPSLQEGIRGTDEPFALLHRRAED